MEGRVAMNSKSTNTASVYRVRDINGILLTLLLFLIVFGLTTLVNMAMAQSFADGSRWFPELVFPANAVLFVVGARLRAIWSGVILNLSAQTLEFQGGGVSANNLIDFLRPTFLLQYLGRTRLKLDEIQQMSVQEVRKATGQATGGVSIERTFYLRLAGGFGTASIKFLNEGKCDAVFAAIRQSNRMGEPVFAA